MIQLGKYKDLIICGVEQINKRRRKREDLGGDYWKAGAEEGQKEQPSIGRGIKEGAAADPG